MLAQGAPSDGQLPAPATQATQPDRARTAATKVSTATPSGRVCHPGSGRVAQRIGPACTRTYSASLAAALPLLEQRGPGAAAAKARLNKTTQPRLLCHAGGRARRSRGHSKLHRAQRAPPSPPSPLLPQPQLAVHLLLDAAQHPPARVLGRRATPPEPARKQVCAQSIVQAGREGGVGGAAAAAGWEGQGRQRLDRTAAPPHCCTWPLGLCSHAPTQHSIGPGLPWATSPPLPARPNPPKGPPTRSPPPRAPPF